MTQAEQKGQSARGGEGGEVDQVDSQVSKGFLGCGDKFGFVSECVGSHGI